MTPQTPGEAREHPAEHDAPEFVTLDEALQRVPHKGLKVGIVRALRRAAEGPGPT